MARWRYHFEDVPVGAVALPNVVEYDECDLIWEHASDMHGEVPVVSRRASGSIEPRRAQTNHVTRLHGSLGSPARPAAGRMTLNTGTVCTTYCPQLARGNPYVMKTTGWPVRLAPVGNVSMGAGLWRVSGQLMVTVVAKATFSFADPDAVHLVEPEPVRQEDEHQGGHPLRSLIGASNLAPQLHKVDVTLVGAARPPAAVGKHAVRLAIASQTTTLLDKTLLVVGKHEEGAPPEPFTEMDLSWGRSFGGIGHIENPIGTGQKGESSRPPNVLPHDGSERTVGFGPIPASFPLRRKLLHADARKRLAKPIRDVPLTVDWGYFQAAPADQQLKSLQGNEWLALDGFCAERPQLRLRLPGGLAVSRIYGFERGGVPNQVPLTLDTLHIQTDDKRLSMAWRGSFPVNADETVEQLVVAAAYLATTDAFEWPAEADLRTLSYASLMGGGAAPARERVDLEGTMTVEARRGKRKEQTLPFAGHKANLPSAITPQDLHDHPLSGTLAIDGATVASLAAHNLAPESAPASPVPADNMPLDGTMAISASAASGAALPFAGAPTAGSSTATDAKAGMPGAPWDLASPARPVVPRSGSGTLDLSEVPSFAAMLAAPSPNKAELLARAEDMAKRSEEKEERIRREADAKQEADAKRETDRDAAAVESEALSARQEAETRRQEAAEKFQREQDEARAEQERRNREEVEKKAESAKKLRARMYGGFKRKG